MIQQLITEKLLGVCGPRSQTGHSIDHVAGQVEAVNIVQHSHIEGGSRSALLLVSANVEILMIRSTIGQAMDQPWITVVGEDYRFVLRKEDIKVLVVQPVRMLTLWLDDKDLRLIPTDSRVVLLICMVIVLLS